MSANVADRATVRIERRFDAPRELVFEAWTKPEYLLRWYSPHGCTLQIAEVDIRPGGRFHFCISNPSFSDWCVGVYQQIVRPERIVYTLEKVGRSTLLTLEQSVLESLAKHTGAHPSWLQMLERLAEVVYAEARSPVAML